MRNLIYRTIRKYALFLVIPVFPMMLQACTPKKHVMPPLAAVEGIQRHFGQGRMIDLKTGKAIDFPDLVDQLGTADVIFVGEVHNNPEHHLIQVQLLQALMARYAPPPAVAMEFFDTTRQPVLDRFMDGDLDETTWNRLTGKTAGGFPTIFTARSCGFPKIKALRFWASTHRMRWSKKWPNQVLLA